ncbi:MAG: T9SS type A sorting domain-containing protein [Bacteroidia bacterium]
MSFEDTIACSLTLKPYAPECAPPWYTTRGSPDYCSTNYSCPATVPPNNVPFGYQYPRTGDAHIGLLIRGYPIFNPNVREYFGVELIDTLKANRIYRTEFYVSLANTCRYATDAIGAHFSDTSTANPNAPHLWIPLIPQIVNQPGNILSDTMNWVLVSDTFVAQGGEKYMTIGNFFNDSNTAFINTYPNNPYLSIYYFIDDVSVVDITTGIQENNVSSLVTIYPNPVIESLTVSSIFIFSEILITDISGKVIYSNNKKAVSKNLKIDSSNWKQGIYFISIVTEKGRTIKKIAKL